MHGRMLWMSNEYISYHERQGQPERRPVERENKLPRAPRRLGGERRPSKILK